jgi:serine protease Do
MLLSKVLLALILLTTSVSAFPRETVQAFSRKLESVTYVLHSNGALCAATMIDKDRGLFLTAAHCIRPHPLTGLRSKLVTLEHSDLKGTIRAKVVKVDNDADLALVDTLLPIRFISEAEILPANEEVYRYQDVYTLGHPLGWAYSGSAGTVSHPHRNEGPVKVDQIQVDMTTNHGNSGGGLFDENGILIGVMSWVVAKDESSPGFGLNFAVSYRAIHDFLKGT